jgi:hypothetical protein
MNVTVQGNKCVVNLISKSGFSRARNKHVSAASEISFEFFEIGDESEIPMDIEVYVSPRDLEAFLFLLTVDFKDYAPGQFKSNLVNGLAEKTYRRLNKEPLQEGFKDLWPDTEHDEKFIFFGGGVDSRAVAGLYPEARHVVLDKVLHSSYRLRKGDVFIKSNLKSGAFRPRGFVFWSQPFAVAPILAAYYRSRYPAFLLGSILGSSYLMNGHRYFDREMRSNTVFGVTGNMYHSLFNELSLPLYAPLANCSEYVSTKVEMLTNKDGFELPAFCQARGGFPCLNCFKCMRKIVERHIVARDMGIDAPYSDISTVANVIRRPRPSILDFSYFYHVWNYAAIKSPEIAELLKARGFEMSDSDNVELGVVYPELERFYQNRSFSYDKLKRLGDLGVRSADSYTSLNIKNYNRSV